MNLPSLPYHRNKFRLSRVINLAIITINSFESEEAHSIASGTLRIKDDSKDYIWSVKYCPKPGERAWHCNNHFTWNTDKDNTIKTHLYDTVKKFLGRRG